MKYISTEIDTYYIPVDFLWKYREFDRCGSDNIYGDEYIDKLTDDIKNNGIKNPINLQIYSNKGLIVEGNHRLCIAKKLGIDKLYVKVSIRAFGSINKKKSKKIEYEPNKWRSGIFE